MTLGYFLMMWTPFLAVMLGVIVVFVAFNPVTRSKSKE
jgi:biopolymer transport protein ExbD